MKLMLPSTRLVGLLFLLAFVLYGVGNGLVTAYPEGSNPPVTPPAYELLRWAGYVLVGLNSVAVVVIATGLFPVLNRSSNPVAVSYLIARIAEAVLLFVGIIRTGNRVAYQTAMLVLGVGSIGFCVVLLRARLIPKSLSVLGLVGYVSLALGALGELLGLPVDIILSMPGGLFELCFGLLLLTKGFTTNKLSQLIGN